MSTSDPRSTALTEPHPGPAPTRDSSRAGEGATDSAVGAVSWGALTRFGHALSDPTRARVLMALREGPSYPADLADLLGVSRQSMSNHLACLRGCGLVVSVPEGRRTRYELTDRRLGHAISDLLDVVLVTDPAACNSNDEPGKNC